MNIELQRKVDRVVGTFICRVLSLLPSGRRQPPVDLKPQKILVILLSEMGSLVLAHPMFERIKTKYPTASLYVLYNPNQHISQQFLTLVEALESKQVPTVKRTGRPHEVTSMAKRFQVDFPQVAGKKVVLLSGRSVAYSRLAGC